MERYNHAVEPQLFINYVQLLVEVGRAFELVNFKIVWPCRLHLDDVTVTPLLCTIIGIILPYMYIRMCINCSCVYIYICMAG